MIARLAKRRAFGQHVHVKLVPEHSKPPISALGTETELQAQRETLRRRLRRANLASVLILAVVFALAVGFVWKARESTVEAERAHLATERAEAELWKSRLNETRAERYAARPGVLLENRKRLDELALRPNLTEEQRLALREEAITQLASTDIDIPSRSVTNRLGTALTWNARLDQYFSIETNGAVAVIDYPSGRRVVELRGVPGSQPHVAVFSPDGRLAAVRFHGGEVRIWEMETTNLLVTTRCVRVANHSGPLLFSPDSRALGMFTSKGFAVQSLEKDSTPRLLQEGRVIDGASFTTDARQLAALPIDNLNVVEIWEVATGRLLKRFEPGFRPTGVEWHPDGRRLAIIGSRGQVSLWEMQPALGSDAGYPKETIRFVGHLGTIVFFMFTPDGSKLFTQSWDNTSRLWDVISGREIFRETRLALNGVSAGSDRLVGIGAGGKQEFICRLESARGFQTVASAGGPRAAQGVWLSPDARLLAIGYPAGQGQTRGEVRLWDFARKVELANVPGIWAQFSPDSRWLYAFEFGGIRRYDVSAATLATPPTNWIEGNLIYKPAAGALVNTGEISGDGKTLTVAAMDRVIAIDAESGKVTGGFKALAHYLSPSRDGLTIGTSYQNNPTVLRNATTGQTLAKSKGVGRSFYSPDTNWIVVAEHDSLRIIRYPSLEKVSDIALNLGASVPPAIAFSADSRMLAVAYNRTDIRLHEVSSGRALAILSPPNQSQIAGGHGIEFSRDGRWLILAREGGDVVAWDLGVVKTELEKLGLGWDGASTPTGHAIASPTAVIPKYSIIETAAFVAAVLTLLGGIFVFAVQRRMLKSYDQVEAVAVDQRRKLDSAQAELLHGQKMRALGTLSAGVAHDFNNLLSVIRLSNQLAAEQTKPTGTAKENVEAIESAVSQGESIVQSMLGYSRAAAELDTSYQVDSVVNETVALLGRKFLAGIILRLEIEQELPLVRGSRGRLEQVLLNLIVNASEAMGGQGALSIRVRLNEEAPNCLLQPRAASRYIELAVEDSGPGIPAEILPRIFEPFFTTKNQSTRPGTGLGLATVYTMAEQDGMGLGVHSGNGTGTTFRILVPADFELRTKS